jgi:EAL domain-containing protein (putative c-di-GMP-specific phosphodiesterase class I)
VVAERLLEELRLPIQLAASNGRDLPISASIGIAAGQRADAEELLRDADLALYRAKLAGKDRFAVFQEIMQIEADDRRTLESDLAVALERDQLFLLYQPTFALSSRRMIGVEALIRWRHPVRGVVAPAAFIPLADQTAMIVPIGRWVLRTACHQAAIWHADGQRIGISVNVTARQLQRDEFVDEVREVLEHSGLPPGALTLEITETVLTHHADEAAERLRAIKTLGVQIAIDDFGTGYSSLAYLRTIPVDAVKIDRSFISAIGSSEESAALMRTLVSLGNTLGLETLGEGIEEPGQLEELLREHCDSGQGFLFSGPLEVDQVQQFLDREQLARATAHT